MGTPTPPQNEWSAQTDQVVIARPEDQAQD